MNVAELIRNAAAERKTRFAFELLPPLKGEGLGPVFGAINPLMEFDPAYINVTFHREGVKQNLLPDGLHPNTEGSKLLARAAYSGITGARERWASRPPSATATAWRRCRT